MQKSNETIPNVPTLRFSSFSNSWENAELRTVCSYRKERRQSHKLNLITTENLLSNYQGVERFNSNEILSGDAFYSGDILVSNIRPYLRKVWKADFDGICNADVLVLQSNSINRDFLYYLIANDKFVNYVMSSVKGSKMPRGDKKVIMDYRFAIPTIAEQSKIAHFLSVLDNKIKIQNKIIKDLKILKKELCNRVFKSFQSVRLGDYIEEVTARNRANDCDNVLSVSNKVGFVRQSEQFEDRTVASEDKRNYKVVTSGCFAYNPARINVGSIALLSTYVKGIISPMYVCFRVKDGLYADYLSFYYQSESFFKELQKRLEGSVRQCLTYENMCDMEIPFTKIERQIEIADALTRFACMIEKEEKYLALLQRQKAYLLNAMFI